MKSISYISLYFILMLFISNACEEPVVETSPLDEDLVFTSATQQAALITNISLLDGSSDNIIDNASCLRLQFPYTVTLNDEVRSITSDQEVSQILSEYLRDPFSRFELEINFPVTAIRQDYSEITISSSTDLQALRNSCVEDGEDDDIECIDFEYPIAIATYDRLNQIADVLRISSDRELYNTLRRSDENDLLSIDFPVSVRLSDGSVEIAASNSELLSAIDEEINNCNEDDLLFDNGRVPIKQLLRLSLTDAPFPADFVEEVNINLTKIEIKTGSENSQVEFITLFEDDITVNILELTNGKVIDLSSTELPVGNYPYMRMFVNDGSVLLSDGRVFDLTVPSGSQSGILIQINGGLTLTDVMDEEIVLDFDISRSLIVQGNPSTPAGINGFNFRPVIKANVVTASGTLEGAVSDESAGTSIADAQITLMAADTLYTSTFSDSNGQYKVLGITPGIFEVFVERNGYRSSEPQTIEINAGDEAVIDFELEIE